MKNVISAGFASVLALGVATGFTAEPVKVIASSDLSGLKAASVTVGLSGPEGQFKEALTPHGAVAQVRVTSFALGAVDSSKLGAALQVQSVRAPSGISVSFKGETMHAGFDELDFYVGVARGVKSGTYPVMVNLHNPLSSADGAVGFNVVVR